MDNIKSLPCSYDSEITCEECPLNYNGCPVDLQYSAIKQLYPIKTVAKPGVDVHRLVKEQFPKQYIDFMLFTFDWVDLDGVLDYLYGLNILHGAGLQRIIELIENNSEVKK